MQMRTPSHAVPNIELPIQSPSDAIASARCIIPNSVANMFVVIAPHPAQCPRWDLPPSSTPGQCVGGLDVKS